MNIYGIGRLYDFKKYYILLKNFCLILMPDSQFRAQKNIGKSLHSAVLHNAEFGLVRLCMYFYYTYSKPYKQK